MRVNEIYREFQNQMDFYIVYIQEIHPTDGWQLPANERDEVLFTQPMNANERAEIAGVCMLHLKFEMPMLLDNMENEVDLKYAALPERLYIVNAAGKIVHRSRMGPWGFDTEEWRVAIEGLVAG